MNGVVRRIPPRRRGRGAVAALAATVTAAGFAAAGFGVASLAVVGGCGYSFGIDRFGAGARTVHVAVVENRTLRQRIEIPLTRALYESLAVHSDLRPAPPSSADTRLDVEIVDIRTRNLVGPGAVPVREGALDFAVLARLSDARTGAVLRERRVLDRAEFRAAVGENEATARAEAVSDLARKIVLALEGEF